MKVENIDRRSFIKYLSTGIAATSLSPLLHCNHPQRKRPNVIVIFCDDLGYGDLGSFGHPTIRTPNLDQMATDGQKWTNFYAASGVCTPSRAGLLTGRYPVRSGMSSDKRGVLFPDSAGGLPESEITIAESLKNEGYKTACIGKWHLGHLPQYLPTRNGFDYYFGIPYSNDMDKIRRPEWNDWLQPESADFNVPLLRNEKIIERPADQTTITRRYTEETIRFINENAGEPFFIYLAHSLPHVPLFASDEFLGTSPRGLYGDVVEEIDHGVGRIINTLKEKGIDKNTLVVFTSDNGPWLKFKELGGSAGLLKDGKGTTYEGGMREPTIFWMPGQIEPDVITGLGSTLDLFATICNVTGAQVPQDRVMDSYDLSPVLFDQKQSPRNSFFYYRGTLIYAARVGAHKAHFITEYNYRKDKERTVHDPPLLYNLNSDPGEQYDIAAGNEDIIKQIMNEVEKHNQNMVKGEDQLVKRIGE